MNVTLRPELKQYIEETIRTGRFPDADAVINGALEALRSRESAQDLERLAETVAIGIRQLDEGKGAPWDPQEIKAEGRQILSKRAGSR